MAHTPRPSRRRKTAEAPEPQAQAAQGETPQIPPIPQAPDQTTVATSNTISTAELRQNLGAVLGSVAYSGASFTVTSHGKEVAQLTPTAFYPDGSTAAKRVAFQVAHPVEHGFQVLTTEPRSGAKAAAKAALEAVQMSHEATAPTHRPAPEKPTQTAQQIRDELLRGVNRNSKG